jgi:hypothetical protein
MMISVERRLTKLVGVIAVAIAVSLLNPDSIASKLRRLTFQAGHVRA